MNSHQRRKQRRSVERGFGPRHAFNAQEGDEEVPGAVASPLPSVPQAPPDRGDRLRRMLLDQVIDPETYAEIARNPTGAKAMAAYASLGIMLMPGHEGGAPRGVPKSGKVPQPGLKVPDMAPRYEGPAEAVPESPYPWKLPEKGFHGKAPKGQTWENLPEWLKKQYPDKEMLTEKDWADIQSYQEAEKDYNPDAHGSDLEKAYGKEDALDKQFPPLNKPPYDALKEPSKLSKMGTPLPPESPPLKNEPWSVDEVSKKFPKPEEPLTEAELWKQWMDSPPGTEIPPELESKYPPLEGDDVLELPHKNSPPPEEPPSLQDIYDDLKAHPEKADFWDKGPGPKYIEGRGMAMPYSDEGEPFLPPPHKSPDKEPPEPPGDPMHGRNWDDLIPPPRFAKGTGGVRQPRKFRGYPPVRKVGVAKGLGPRHAENAQEGDLTKVNTDTVPAMLTPREAVLNRNAAELAGRPNIEALNEQGNELAKKGVDLASGESNIPDPKAGDRRLAGTGAASYLTRELFEKYGGSPTAFELVPDFVKYISQEYPQMAQKGTANMKPKPKPTKPKPGAPKPAPMPRPQPQPAPGGGGFYPPGQGLNFASGSDAVPAGIGQPNPQMAYDPRAQVDFKAPDLSGFLKDMRAEAQKRGISPDQMSQIAKQFAGMGGGSGYANQSLSAGEDFGNPNYIGLGTPSYQGGISEVGYPPGIAPNADFSYTEGGWTGPLDPRWSSPGYAGGESDIEPPMLRGNINPDAWVANLPPGVTTFGGRHHPGSGFVNRSSYNPGSLSPSSFMGPNQLGFQPPPWAAGFSQGPTQIPTTLGNSGYPMGVPVNGPDQNLQGVGRTHNLRYNV